MCWAIFSFNSVRVCFHSDSPEFIYNFQQLLRPVRVQNLADLASYAWHILTFLLILKGFNIGQEIKLRTLLHCECTMYMLPLSCYHHQPYQNATESENYWQSSLIWRMLSLAEGPIWWAIY